MTPVYRVAYHIFESTSVNREAKLVIAFSNSNRASRAEYNTFINILAAEVANTPWGSSSMSGSIVVDFFLYEIPALGNVVLRSCEFEIVNIYHEKELELSMKEDGRPVFGNR